MAEFGSIRGTTATAHTTRLRELSGVPGGIDISTTISSEHSWLVPTASSSVCSSCLETGQLAKQASTNACTYVRISVLLGLHVIATILLVLLLETTDVLFFSFQVHL